MTPLHGNFNVYEASELESTQLSFPARKDRGHHQSLITACHNMTDRLYTDIAQIFLTTITKNNRKAP